MKPVRPFLNMSSLTAEEMIRQAASIEDKLDALKSAYNGIHRTTYDNWPVAWPNADLVEAAARRLSGAIEQYAGTTALFNASWADNALEKEDSLAVKEAKHLQNVALAELAEAALFYNQAKKRQYKP